MNYLGKINTLAYLSLFDTSDEEYKNIDETYPLPNSTATHFILSGHLRRYSAIVDEDTWLIFHNNVGLLNVDEQQKTLIIKNLFLHSKNIVSPAIRAISG